MPAVPSPPRPEPPWLDAALRAAADALARPVELRDAAGTVVWRNAAAVQRGAASTAPTEPRGAGVMADYARLFQLTPAEAALLPGLAGPHSLAALARERRLATSTLRRRAQSLALKVGLHGVEALRRELRGLPPLRA